MATSATTIGVDAASGTTGAAIVEVDAMLPPGRQLPSTTVALIEVRPPHDVACHGGVAVPVVLTLRSSSTLAVPSRWTVVTPLHREDAAVVAYMSLR